MQTLKIKYLTGFGEKIIGLIGKKPVYPICFSTRWGIHTFGMAGPIDVIILDNSFRIDKLVHRLPPNRIFFWNPIYSTVIELPAGEIKKRNMAVGNLVNLSG